MVLANRVSTQGKEAPFLVSADFFICMSFRVYADLILRDCAQEQAETSRLLRIRCCNISVDRFPLP